MEILLVGLGEATSGVVSRVLAARGHQQTLAATGKIALEALVRSVPFIVVEDPLPDMSGADFCRQARAESHGVDSVILVITHRDHELGAVLDAGATDLYFTSLGPSALETRLLIAERLVAKQAELRGRESRFRRLFDSGVAGVTIADLDGNFKEANQAFLEMLGYTREEMIAGKLNWTVITPPDWLVPDIEARAQLRSTGFLPLREREYVHKDGRHISALVGAAMLADTGEAVTYVTDLTEKKRAEAALRRTEEQLRQAQKMDAVGRLAGGIAHDFNNLLSVVLSYAELILMDLKEGDPLRADVLEIAKAGSRAAGLTRQLLMFSRQQVLEPKVIDLHEALASMDQMLQRILGEDVELVLVAPKSGGRVKVDPSHIEQVILNLVVNARDAMPKGGKLTIETNAVVLDEDYAQTHLPAKAGAYMMVAVSDTGTGLDGETQSRMFEPFYTTKEKGRGTGLGLATVFGIVKQSGGHIWVYSELGIGTTFKIYLPRVDADVDVLTRPIAPTTLRGTETILLVEDEEQVRTIVLNILRRQGYAVMPAQNAGEALLLCKQHSGAIDLLLTDVVMPQMSGPALAKLLASTRPEMKVLCMSGYTDDSIVRYGVLDADMAYLQKPITPQSLSAKLREMLDPSKAAPAQQLH